jgi:ribosomal protein L18
MEILNKEEKQIGDSGHGFETIKIKKYEKGVKPSGKRAYEESIDRDKISKKGKLAKERLIINRKERKKIHKVWEKDKNGDWILVHNEEKEF